MSEENNEENRSLSKIKNIYGFTALKSSKMTLDKNYSYLVSQLISIEHEVDKQSIDIKDYASRILSVVNSVNCFFNIDRVCLVYTQPLSCKLSVLSSANLDESDENIMATGYSCYVSEYSSLFKIENSSIRIYDDIDDILKTYQNKSIQRSLFRLSKMGIKSGITIPLGNFGFFSGILFLNSKKKAAFTQFQDEDYSVLSMLKLISSNILYRNLHRGISVDSYLLRKIEENRLPNIFDINLFKSVFVSLFKNRFKNFEMKITEKDFDDTRILYNPNSLIYFLFRLFEYDDTWRISSLVHIEISFLKDQQELEIRIKDMVVPFERLAFFDELGIFMSESLKIENNSIVMRFKVEINELNVNYSV
jgi:hypothetical protein